MIKAKKYINVKIWNMHGPEIEERCRVHNGMETSTKSLTSAVKMVRDRIKRDDGETFWSLSYEPSKNN